MDLWTRLWGRYHVPHNVFLVKYMVIWTFAQFSWKPQYKFNYVLFRASAELILGTVTCTITLYVGVCTSDRRPGGQTMSVGDERCPRAHYRSFFYDISRWNWTTNDGRMAWCFQPGVPWTRRTGRTSARILRLDSTCRPVSDSQRHLTVHIVDFKCHI